MGTRQGRDLGSARAGDAARPGSGTCWWDAHHRPQITPWRPSSTATRGGLGPPVGRRGSPATVSGPGSSAGGALFPAGHTPTPSPPATPRTGSFPSLPVRTVRGRQHAVGEGIRSLPPCSTTPNTAVAKAIPAVGHVPRGTVGYLSRSRWAVSEQRPFGRYAHPPRVSVVGRLRFS